MIGIYLSGTGNTKYCITKLVKLIDASADVVPLEDESVIDKIKRNGTIILGYPTQFSNAPYECLFVEGQENDMCCDNGSIEWGWRRLWSESFEKIWSRDS